jgi:hypothetical protein
MRTFIFLWFLAVGLVSVIGAIWIGRSLKQTAADMYESDAASRTTETIAHVLDAGGVSALHDLEGRLDPKGKIRFFVFDTDSSQVPESRRRNRSALSRRASGPAKTRRSSCETADC